MSARAALVHRYARDYDQTPNITAEGVASFFLDLEAFPDDMTLAAVIEAERPDWVLPADIFAIIACIDDCDKLIFRLVELEDSMESRLRQVLPALAAGMIERPSLPLDEDKHTILSVLDHLAQALIGWLPELGAAGKKLTDKVDEALAAAARPDADCRAISKDLEAFLEKEQSRVNKLEARLAASETGIVRAQQAKVLSANMINMIATGKQVTATLQNFLVGPWNEAVQWLVTNEGIEGETWQRAEALTRTVLWTYQPIDPKAEGVGAQKQKLYRIIEHLPGELREMLADRHSTDEAEQLVGAIEEEHFVIVSGQQLELAEFNPLPSDAPATKGPEVSQRLLKKVLGLEPGQWFTYEEQDKSARIKLVLKLDDVRQLLFTNRNGMKVMQKSFDEFAYYLSSHIVKPLSHQAVFSSTFRTYYQGLIDEFDRFRTQVRERKAEVERLEEEREAARRKAEQEAEALEKQKAEKERERIEAEKMARMEEAKAALLAADQADVDQVAERVGKLNTGAFLRLPDPDGKLEDCKLAVKITAADKMIFVNRAGTKVGEYNTEQLIQLIVSKQAEIADAGVEFEDTLAQVVTRLRQDRTKSYDDLTGS